MISIDYSFLPMRMVLSRREPVEFTIEIKNSGNKSEMVSLEVLLTKDFSLGKGTFKNNILERIASLKAGEKKTFHYNLHANPLYMELGEKIFRIVATTHHNNYNYAEERFEKEAILIVSE